MENENVEYKTYDTIGKIKKSLDKDHEDVFGFEIVIQSFSELQNPIVQELSIQTENSIKFNLMKEFDGV